jgi:hypothetical protein
MAKTVRVTFDKRTNVSVDSGLFQAYTTEKAIQVLKSVNCLISVQWTVYSADTAAHDNKVMLQRANRIATAICKSVSCFDQINGVIYGCVIS